MLLSCTWPLDQDIVRRVIFELMQYYDELRFRYDQEEHKLIYTQMNHEEEVPFLLFRVNGDRYFCYDEIKNLLIKDGVSLSFGSKYLLKVILVEMTDGKQQLLLIAHHLIIDGVSWRILLNDFFRLYDDYVHNRKSIFEKKTLSYQTWSNILKRESEKIAAKDLEYWAEVQRKATFIERNEVTCYDSFETRECVCEVIDGNELLLLQKYPQQVFNLDLDSFLMFVLVYTIAKEKNEQEIVILLERHGREDWFGDVDVTRTIGWFTNMFPAVFTIEENTLKDSLISFKEQWSKIRSKSYEYGLLKYLDKKIPGKLSKGMRYNFLGDLSEVIMEDKQFICDMECGLDSHPQNSFTPLIEFEISIVNKQLVINVFYSNVRYRRETIQELIKKYVDHIRLFLNECMERKGKVLSPSDFKFVTVSQDDIDAIFVRSRDEESN